jgi:quercetin dioxygenase-like cupin family protein
MLTVDLNAVELTESPTPTGSIRVDFPFHSGTGTASTAAVLLELEPGNELATHTDSAEEVLLVLTGEADAHVEGQRARLRAGQVAIVPAMAPHGLRNSGETVLRVLGIFSSATVVSTFEEPRGPEGERIFVTGAARRIMAQLEEPSTLAV